MRFVHYYPRALGDSGVTVALWAWARAMTDAGCEVAVLHADRVERADQIGVFRDPTVGAVDVQAIPHIGSRRATFRPLGLGRYLRPNDLLIIHEGWVVSNFVAAAAANRRGIRYVATPHGVYDPLWISYLRRPRGLRRLFERRLLENALAVHTFFETEHSAIMMLAPRARFITVPTGFDVMPQRWIGGGGYLAWVGRYDPLHKGLDLMVEAVRAIPETERPVIKLRGYDYKGGLRTLQRAIREADVGRWVQVGGPIGGHEKQEFLLRADGAILPSRWEAQGLALIETLALGLPNLVTSTIHMAPLLRNAGAALIAAPEPIALAEAMLKLPEDAATLGSNGRRFVAREFAWNRVAKDYLGQIGGLLATFDQSRRSV